MIIFEELPKEEQQRIAREVCQEARQRDERMRLFLLQQFDNTERLEEKNL